MEQKEIAYQYTEWCKGKLSTNIQHGARKTVYQYTEWCKGKLSTNIQHGAKKTVYQYTEWCKGKLSTNIQHGGKKISIQNGAKENCLPIYNMVQRKLSINIRTEWCKSIVTLDV